MEDRKTDASFDAEVPVMPLSGFRLYDDLVIVESIVGEQQLAEPDDVARYEKYLELLREAASIGQRGRSDNPAFSTQPCEPPEIPARIITGRGPRPPPR